MARTTDEIIEIMDEAQADESALSELNSPSTTSIFSLFKSIVATVCNQMEQLWDIKKLELEEVVDSAPIGSDAWLRSKVLEFQYDAVTPQVIEIDSNFVARYPVIDTTLRIITRASVKTTSGLVVTVKVAKDEPPTALSVGELASLQGYLTGDTVSTGTGDTGGIASAGIAVVATSVAPDELSVIGVIYYNGQYAPVISANVIAAMDAYLANIPFDGYVSVNDLQIAIRSVTGVSDLALSEVAIRANGILYASRTKLVDASDLLFYRYETVAGYVVQETTATKTFADLLVFTAI